MLHTPPSLYVCLLSPTSTPRDLRDSRDNPPASPQILTYAIIIESLLPTDRARGASASSRWAALLSRSGVWHVRKGPNMEASVATGHNIVCCHVKLIIFLQLLHLLHQDLQIYPQIMHVVDLHFIISPSFSFL
jgi:hypothetical protein